VLIRLIRMRPFLWLLGLALAAVLVSITWERATSYDDGGLGTAAFLLLITIGAPFLLPSQLLGGNVGGNGWSWGLLYWGAGLGSLLAFYLGLDRLSLSWLRRRERRVDHSDAEAGA
jgi:hypothetical protein